MSKLMLDQASKRQAEIPQWRLSNDRGGLLHRRFVFRDFAQAFAFMSEMAQWSEKAQHHPEWSNVYNWVDVHLTTHDVGGLSDKDFDWALRADQAAISVAEKNTG